MANHGQETKNQWGNPINMQEKRQQRCQCTFEKVNGKGGSAGRLSQNTESIGRSGIAAAVFPQVLFKENLPNPKPGRNRAQ